MKQFLVNTHKFTAQEVDGKFIMTGDGYFGRVRVENASTIEVTIPFLAGRGISFEIDYLNDCDVIVMTEEETQNLLAPIVPQAAGV